jgi:hypothetical protein
MPLVPYNSVGGYSTGLTMTGVIDSLGHITGVGATFSGLIRANAGISAAGGVTLAGTLQGTTSSFTGLISSTVGFSGPGTNLTGNASGLTAGTATAVNISTSNTATTQYLVFASGVGGKTLGIDSTTSPLTYVPSTGSLSVGSSTSSSLSATSVNTTTIYGPNTEFLTLTNNGGGIVIEDSGGGAIAITNSLSSINLDSPYSIVIGDISGIAGGGNITVADNTGTCTITALDFVAGVANLTGTLTGVTANFTGRVSSTVGFSGPGTNITGVVTSFNNQTGAVTGVTVGGTNVFTALNSFNAGISAAGSTFSGNINLQDNTLSRVELLDYCERFVDLGDFASKGSPIPIDLSTGQVFRLKYTLAGTGLSVTNVPDNANANTVGFTLLFVGDGTARTMTWNIGSTAIGWAGGIAPTYTSTLNKIDVYSFLTRDGGSNWLGFVGGQNF